MPGESSLMRATEAVKAALGLGTKKIIENSPLSLADIEADVLAHYARNGEWPKKTTKDRGVQTDLPFTTIAHYLQAGRRGLTKSTLATIVASVQRKREE